MPDKTPSDPSPQTARADEMFPTLTAAQIARIAAHGWVRTFEGGEVLVQAGERATRFFVVISGQIEIVQPTARTAEPVAVFRPGMFTGEVTMLSGRRALAHIRLGFNDAVDQTRLRDVGDRWRRAIRPRRGRVCCV